MGAVPLVNTLDCVWMDGTSDNILKVIIDTFIDFDELFEIWNNFRLEGFRLYSSKSHIKESIMHTVNLFMKRCAEFELIESIPKAKLYCEFVLKYFVHEERQFVSYRQEPDLSFLLDNFEAFHYKNYPYTKTLCEALVDKSLTPLIDKEGVDRIVKFILPRALEYIAMGEAGDELIELLTRGAYYGRSYEWPPEMYEFMDYTLTQSLSKSRDQAICSRIYF
jgi:hypothetical protein